jgi:shikimate kinase
MNITLIGYRATGKSLLASRLAARLGWDWADADVSIESLAGRTIREIFEREAEAGFREREAAVIRELTARDRLVIAAGGGVVLRADNRAAIRTGKVVWLTASPNVICQRLERDNTTAARRPNLTAAGGIVEIRRLLAEREPLYRQCADLIVATDDRAPDELVTAILEGLGPAVEPLINP